MQASLLTIIASTYLQISVIIIKIPNMQAFGLRYQHLALGLDLYHNQNYKRKFIIGKNNYILKFTET
jgi:hypothetical protein